MTLRDAAWARLQACDIHWTSQQSAQGITLNAKAESMSFTLRRCVPSCLTVIPAQAGIQ